MRKRKARESIAAITLLMDIGKKAFPLTFKCRGNGGIVLELSREVLPKKRKTK